MAPLALALLPCPSLAGAALNQELVHRYYFDGNFDKAIEIIEDFHHENPDFSRSDSIFMFKYLGVLYSSDRKTQKEGERNLALLLAIDTAASLDQLYVSEYIQRIFQGVKEAKRAQVVATRSANPTEQPLSAPTKAKEPVPGPGDAAEPGASAVAGVALDSPQDEQELFSTPLAASEPAPLSPRSAGQPPSSGLSLWSSLADPGKTRRWIGSASVGAIPFLHMTIGNPWSPKVSYPDIGFAAGYGPFPRGWVPFIGASHVYHSEHLLTYKLTQASAGLDWFPRNSASDSPSLFARGKWFTHPYLGMVVSRQEEKFTVYGVTPEAARIPINSRHDFRFNLGARAGALWVHNILMYSCDMEIYWKPKRMVRPGLRVGLLL